MVNLKKPDQEVANRIIDQVRKKELLSDPALEKLGPKLVAGTLSADDWKLALELDRVPGRQNRED